VSTFAAVPQTLHYSGKLNAAAGAFTGTIDITFTLYADANATTGFWSETQAVNAQSGRFHVVLGNTTPLTAADVNVAALHLGVKVATDNEMAKVPISSVPYALQAANAATLGGLSVEELGASKAVRSKPIIDKVATGSTTSQSTVEIDAIEPLVDGNRLTPTSIFIQGKTSTSSSQYYSGQVFVRFHYADTTTSDHGSITFTGTSWTSKNLSIPIHDGFRGDIVRISLLARRVWSTNYTVFGQMTLNGYETEPTGLVGAKPIIDKVANGNTNSQTEVEIASISPLHTGNLITPTSIQVKGKTSTSSSQYYSGRVIVRFHYADGKTSDHGSITFTGTSWTSKNLTIPIHSGFQHNIEKISLRAVRVWSTNYTVYGEMIVNGFETVQ